jgi:DNA-binding MarR family transcriptional regulator
LQDHQRSVAMRRRNERGPIPPFQVRGHHEAALRWATYGTASGRKSQMSITAIQILQAMDYEGGHIEVLRGPTPQYEEYISDCRANGLVVKLAGTISREMLNDLVEANFVERDGPENERNVTIFKLTDEGREAANLKPNKSRPPRLNNRPS